jgi:hypothetical protein
MSLALPAVDCEAAPPLVLPVGGALRPPNPLQGMPTVKLEHRRMPRLCQCVISDAFG